MEKYLGFYLLVQRNRKWRVKSSFESSFSYPLSLVLNIEEKEYKISQNSPSQTSQYIDLSLFPFAEDFWEKLAL